MAPFRAYHHWTDVQTAAYLAIAMDAIPCDTTGGTFPVTLPAEARTNDQIVVKWVAGTTPPTVVAESGRVIDPSWAGFGRVGDAAIFSDDGTTWHLI